MMNKEEIVIDNGHLIHYLNDHEFYEYDTLYIDTLDYLDKLQQENKQLKDNWNKLGDYIVKEYYIYLPLNANTKCITILIDKMQELEKGDSNE